MLRYVDRFGADAVFGRPVGAGELRSMVISENVVNAYNMRKDYKDEEGKVDWVAFADDHPDMSALLIMAVTDD